ncbi:alpha/beta hydrolase [Streptomyces flavochromogenes]|uniref:Alpha/beta hydrolase n=1 Tax=Streptomyces flavochromogenes TaxID=68199 RepID=A0ABW6XP94_9ACTN|nr:alpha/beta hydrolase [Streptomyces flavochromogenes]
MGEPGGAGGAASPPDPDSTGRFRSWTSGFRPPDDAGTLRDFTGGLRASHQGEPTHLTVVGRSYGSMMVGTADSGGKGLGADDMIVVGSPGLVRAWRTRAASSPSSAPPASCRPTPSSRSSDLVRPPGRQP